MTISIPVSPEAYKPGKRMMRKDPMRDYVLAVQPHLTRSIQVASSVVFFIPQPGKHKNDVNLEGILTNDGPPVVDLLKGLLYCTNDPGVAVCKAEKRYSSTPRTEIHYEL